MDSKELGKAAKNLREMADSYFARALIHGARFYVLGGCFEEAVRESGVAVLAPPETMNMAERAEFSARQAYGDPPAGEGSWVSNGGLICGKVQAYGDPPAGEGRPLLEALEDHLARHCYMSYAPWRAVLSPHFSPLPPGAG